MLLEKNTKYLICKFFLVIILMFFVSNCLGMDDKEKDPSKMIRITKTQVNEIPYNAIVSVECTFHMGDSTLVRTGTGFIIDRHIALIAAHVFFWNKSLPYQIVCYISRHDQSYTQKIKVKKYIFSTDYEKNKGKIKDDYAIFYIKSKSDYLYSIIEPCVMKIETPINLENIKTKESSESLMICGYPGKEYEDADEFARIPFKIFPVISDSSQPEILQLANKLYGGMSGAPIIFKEKDDSHKAIAIYCSNSVLKKSKKKEEKFLHAKCCRFTDKKLENIFKWKDLIIDDTISPEELFGKVKEYGGTLQVIEGKKDCEIQ